MLLAVSGGSARVVIKKLVYVPYMYVYIIVPGCADKISGQINIQWDKIS